MFKRIISILLCTILVLVGSVSISEGIKSSAEAPNTYFQYLTTPTTTNSWVWCCPQSHGSYTSPSLYVTETSTTVRTHEWINGEGNFEYYTTYIYGSMHCSICGYSDSYSRVFKEGYKQSDPTVGGGIRG